MPTLLGLLGGLALFLYGMQMMSSGLEAAAGNRMKSILERLTSNRILGVLVGAVITTVIQSSSATTVMVVGFVNSGLMTLQQAVWIIMGANIGTTITGQLIALDVGALAPLFAFVGVAMVVFVKKPQVRHIGSILAGLGVLFIGMDMMGAAMEPLRDSPAFVNLVTTFSNPLVGILVGLIFTAIIQSSSASVGILQALAGSGVIGLGSAVYVLFGQNIGTCVTAVLASVGTSRNAKRTTIIHLMFNVLGTILFTVVCMTTPLTDFVAGLTPTNPAAQIANMHTLFNVVTTLLLLPFGGQLVKLAMRVLPERPSDAQEGMHLAYLTALPTHTKQEHPIGYSAMYLNQLRQELGRMLTMAQDNISMAFRSVLDRDPKLLEKAEETEEYLDYLNKEISQYISKVMVHETNERDSALVSAYFKITGNIERIGDHAFNICEYSAMLEKKKIHFSEEARAEIVEMGQVCQNVMDTLEKEHDPKDLLRKVAALEQRMDDMTEEYRCNQLQRMKSGTCSDEACIIFSELLTDFERIGDHALNIAEEQATINTSDL